MELMSVLLVVFFIPEIESIGKFWSIIIGLALTFTFNWLGLAIYFLIYLLANK